MITNFYQFLKPPQGFLKTVNQLTILALVIALTSSNPYHRSDRNFKHWEWLEINDNAMWSPRAGLQVLQKGQSFFLMGGRTPTNPAVLPFPVPGASEIWGDVWRSKNYGKSWKRVLETDDQNHWPARAYFQAVAKGKYMYVLGGQNFNVIPNPAPPPAFPPFVSQSDFFNDVWRSEDGVNWELLTANAPWDGRAGLSAVVFKGEIYVMGGSVNDDSAIIGPGGPVRIYFNDVWKSKNGRDWVQLVENAPWEPRAGGIAVVKDGYIYMIGGEDGFICNDQTPRCPPYFNDVWRTRNGADWQLVTQAAEWIARPGHQVVVANNKFVLFGGFGLGFDITIPSNPMDVWISDKGRKWKKISDSPWNAQSPTDIKYDFDALTVRNRKGGSAIFTFGGDRETFDFSDPFNYLNVDNDVWSFAAPDHKHPPRTACTFAIAGPNPFNDGVKLSYKIPQDGFVEIAIFNKAGNRVATLVSEQLPAGSYSCSWNGIGRNGQPVPEDLYLAKFRYGKHTRTLRLLKGR